MVKKTPILQNDFIVIINTNIHEILDLLSLISMIEQSIQGIPFQNVFVSLFVKPTLKLYLQNPRKNESPLCPYRSLELIGFYLKIRKTSLNELIN